jgi:hypothetical protein
LPQPEGGAPDFGRRLVGDHGIARGSANSLTNSVGEARAHQCQGAVGQRKERLGQSRKAVAGDDPRLAAGAAVGQSAGDQLGEIGRSFGDTVDRAQGRRRQAEGDGHKGWQQGMIDLARHIHQQADEAEHPDSAGDAGTETHDRLLPAILRPGK